MQVAITLFTINLNWEQVRIMIKKISRRLKTYLIAPFICGAVMTGFTSPALADDSSTLTQTPCKNDTDCLVHGYGTSERIMMFQPTYDQLQSMLSGTFIGQLLQPYQPNSLSPALTFNGGTTQSLMTLLTSQGQEPQNAIKTIPGLLSRNIVIDPSSSSSQSASPDQQTKALNTLNLESLISPMVYRTISQDSGTNINQQQLAQSYIIYAAGLVNPVQALDFSSIKYPTDKYNNLNDFLKDAQKTNEVATYLMNLRTYAAQQATGISNLFQLYYERMPITDSTTLQQAISIMTPPPGSSLSAPPPPNQLSLLQMQQYLATRRINDTNWYTQMQNATPATLSREILYLLAELPPALFQLHLDLERLIATVSVLEIQQTANSRLTLEQSRDNANSALQSQSSPEQSDTQTDTTAEQQQQATDALNSQDEESSTSTSTDTTNTDTSTSQ